LNALARRDPRTRAEDVQVAYSVNYTSSPPTYGIFPVSDIPDGGKYIELGGRTIGPVSNSRELLELVCAGDKMSRIVQVAMWGHAGMPVKTFHFVGTEELGRVLRAVPRTFNPQRPRGVDKDESILAVQSDWTDIVMVDAIYGRTLAHDEFHMYMSGFVHLGSADQEKTVVERADDAVRRHKDQKESPCCRDPSGCSI